MKKNAYLSIDSDGCPQIELVSQNQRLIIVASDNENERGVIYVKKGGSMSVEDCIGDLSLETSKMIRKFILNELGRRE